MYQPTYATDASHGTPEAPRARVRRRPAATTIALAALLTLILVPVTVDRLVTERVESRTAEAFQEGMDTPARPEVHVRGFPVLTQVASGTLRRVDITAHDIPADGSARPLPLSELDLRLDGLTASDDDNEARARSAEATARLSYRDVSDALGLEVSQGGGPGRIGAEILLPLGGGRITVTTTVSAASGNRIAFDDFQVEGAALPAAGEAVLDQVFAQPIQLRNIPDGLSLRSVTTTATGLDARFTGRSVTFRPDGASSDHDL
ncbi:LmeA family phospholipid-binding protein [Streptomyces sp. NPDC002740]